jgi:hypothetical protein
VSRLGKIVSVVAAALFSISALGAALGWRAWTRTPAYSLKQLAKGIEHHDRYEFEKYVDIDTLLQAALYDTTEGNALAGAVGTAFISTLKPQLIKLVEDGYVPADPRFAKGVQTLRDPSFAPVIEQSERNAYVIVPTTTNGGAPFSLRIHLTQVADGYWRIDRVANLKELKAAEAEEERLRKLAVAKENDDKLAKLVVAARLKTSVANGYYGFDRKNRIQLRLENKSPKRIAKMTAEIRFPAQEYKEGIRGDIDLDPGAGGTFRWELDVNRFIEPTERVYGLGETDAFVVDVDSITYADGTRVRRGSEEN